MTFHKRLCLGLLSLVMCVSLLSPCVSGSGGYDPDGWTGSHTHHYTGAQVRVEPSCVKDGYIGTRCVGCDSVRKDTVLPAKGHNYVLGVCTRCQAEDPNFMPGDLTGDGEVNNDDVVLLLWNTLFPEEYPVDVDADFTGDGNINNEDVVLLLWHTLFPEDYPL